MQFGVFATKHGHSPWCHKSIGMFLVFTSPRYSWIDASAPEQRNREQVKIGSGVIRV